MPGLPPVGTGSNAGPAQLRAIGDADEVPHSRSLPPHPFAQHKTLGPGSWASPPAQAKPGEKPCRWQDSIGSRTRPLRRPSASYPSLLGTGTEPSPNRLSEIQNKSGEQRSDRSPTTMRPEGWGGLHRDTANTLHPEGFCSLSPLYLGKVAGTCPVQKAWHF